MSRPSEPQRMFGYERGPRFSGVRWQVPGADALSAQFSAPQDVQRINGLVRNGIKRRLEWDKPSPRPLPGNNGTCGRVRVIVDNNAIHWACNPDRRLNEEERLQYPHFEHYEIELEVIDYSGSPVRHESIQALCADLSSNGYSTPTHEETCHFALQWEVPRGKHLYVGTGWTWLPRYPDLSMDIEGEEGAPFMTVLRWGGCIEVWHVDQHETFRDLSASGFLVRPPRQS